MTVNRVHIPYIPAPMEKPGAARKQSQKNEVRTESFAQVLEKTRSKNLPFSSHARKRLQLLYRDMAFIAGVPSRTIITALDGESIREHVFTNIDSTVLVD